MERGGPRPATLEIDGHAVRNADTLDRHLARLGLPTWALASDELPGDNLPGQ